MLREQVYRHAYTLARRYRLDRYIHSWDRGMGYLIDLPEPRDAPANQELRQWAWWTLITLSEALAHDSHMQYLPGSYELARFVQEDPHTVRSRMGSPAYLRLGMTFLSEPSVPDADIQELMRLVRMCRQLRQAATERNIDLWEG